jgi:hypothetical protein
MQLAEESFASDLKSLVAISSPWIMRSIQQFLSE